MPSFRVTAYTKIPLIQFRTLRTQKITLLHPYTRVDEHKGLIPFSAAFSAAIHTS
jgi:hypothetical protein